VSVQESAAAALVPVVADAEGSGELAQRFGPVVLRRYGNAAEIFGGDPLGGFGKAAMVGGWMMLTMGIREFGDIHGWGLWSVLLRVATIAGFVGLLSLSSRRWRRRFSRIRRADDLTGVPSGTPIRISGTVEAEGKLARAPGTDSDAVFARTQFWPAGPRERPAHFACEEIRGTPFRIRLADGVSVRVMPAEVALTDGPKYLSNVDRNVLQALGAASRGAVFRREAPFCEDTLAPGDRIEAVGRLVTEVSAAGEGAPARGVLLVHTLRPLDKAGVRVRRSSAR
jgi:hypothetical protein